MLTEEKAGAPQPCGDLRGMHMTNNNLLCSPSTLPPSPSLSVCFPLLSPIGHCRKRLFFFPTHALQDIESFNFCPESHRGFGTVKAPPASKSSISAWISTD